MTQPPKNPAACLLSPQTLNDIWSNKNQASQHQKKSHKGHAESGLMLKAINKHSDAPRLFGILLKNETILKFR